MDISGSDFFVHAGYTSPRITQENSFPYSPITLKYKYITSNDISACLKPVDTCNSCKSEGMNMNGTLRNAVIAAVSACIMLAVFSSCGGNMITVAKNGSSRYAIVLSSEASLSEKHAADELATCIKLATGADLPIVGESDSRAKEPARIFIGKGWASQEAMQESGGLPEFGNPEEFVIKTLGSGKNADIVIAGHPQRGTMYGVYTFLDKLGFRWYTKRVTRFPAGKKLVTAPLDIRDKPAFISRDTTIREASDGDWAARNRMNSGHANLDAERGGLVRVNGVHTLDLLVPPELFDKHPEYFPLIGGKRVTGLVQRCLSNPELVDIAAENLVKWMDTMPDQRIFSVSANDVGMLCQCDECKSIMEEEGATSGLFLRFVNAVAERIEKTHPDHYISTLAYAITETAPKITKPRDNVIIRLCPFYICCGHTFTECSKPASVNFYKTLQEWGAISPNIFIWHYATNFDAYLLPFPNFKEFTRDIKVYADNHVNGLFLQGAGKSGSSDGDMRAWVASRLMWNPTLDKDALIDEWMHAIYGAGYEPMRAVFDHMHTRVAAPDKHLGIHERILKEDWPDSELAMLDNLYDKAVALTAGDSDALYYIEKNRMSIRYLKLLFNSGRLILDEGTYRPEGNTVSYDDYKQFRDDMVKYDIEGLREEPFDCLYEDLLGEKLRPHETVSIENGDMKVVVVPDLGGRIISIVLNATGEEILGETDPLNYFYPAYGGYEESTTMTWGRTGFSNVYTADIKGRTMTLTAPEGISARSGGLIFKRTMSIPEKGTRIDFESTITNISQGMKYARLISHIELDADPSQSVAGWIDASGKTVEEDVKKGFYKDGANTPRGSWYIKNKTTGWTVENRFPARDIEACHLMCYDTTKTLELETLGFEKNLAPGEKIVRKHSYEIRK